MEGAVGVLLHLCLWHMCSTKTHVSSALSFSGCPGSQRLCFLHLNDKINPLEQRLIQTRFGSYQASFNVISLCHPLTGATILQKMKTIADTTSATSSSARQEGRCLIFGFAAGISQLLPEPGLTGGGETWSQQLRLPVCMQTAYNLNFDEWTQCALKSIFSCQRSVSLQSGSFPVEQQPNTIILAKKSPPVTLSRYDSC